MKTKLPERWRLARNIDEGYELRRVCPEHGDEWVRVTRALHISGPIRVSALTIERLDGPHSCVGDGRVSVHPDDEVYSRRPAVSDA